MSNQFFENSNFEIAEHYGTWLVRWNEENNEYELDEIMYYQVGLKTIEYFVDNGAGNIKIVVDETTIGELLKTYNKEKNARLLLTKGGKLFVLAYFESTGFEGVYVPKVLKAFVS